MGVDFWYRYSQSEVEEMKLSIEMFLAAGADGFVFGCLKTVKVGHHSNTGLMVDAEVCSNLIQKCHGKPVTFHRAFDLCFSPEEALQICEHLGKLTKSLIGSFQQLPPPPFAKGGGYS